MCKAFFNKIDVKKIPFQLNFGFSKVVNVNAMICDQARRRKLAMGWLFRRFGDGALCARKVCIFLTKIT